MIRALKVYLYTRRRYRYLPLLIVTGGGIWQAGAIGTLYKKAVPIDEQLEEVRELVGLGFRV